MTNPKFEVGQVWIGGEETLWRITAVDGHFDYMGTPQPITAVSLECGTCKAGTIETFTKEGWMGEAPGDFKHDLLELAPGKDYTADSQMLIQKMLGGTS